MEEDEILQRALKYANNIEGIDLTNETHRNLAISLGQSYVKGATEQQEIIVNRACEWLEKQWREDDMASVSISQTLCEFRQAMEGE